MPLSPPSSIAAASKYRVKLVPGPVKRGKAVQTALAAFATLSRDGAGGTARERELIRCIADAEANAQMVGGVKVSTPAPLTS